MEIRSAQEWLHFAPLQVQQPQPSRASVKAHQSRLSSRYLQQLSEIPNARYAKQMATPFERSRAFSGKRGSAHEQIQSTVLRRGPPLANQRRFVALWPDGQERFQSERSFQ